MRKAVFWRAIDGLSRCRLPSFTTANATDGTAGNDNAPYIFPQYDSRLNIRRQAVSSPTDDSLNKVKYHEAVMKNLFFHIQPNQILSTFAKKNKYTETNVIMKKIILILFAAIAIAAQAQNAQITSPDGGMNVYRKVKKQAYDTAQVNVYYKLKYLKDSTKTDKYTETQTIVQVSDRYARFGEYYQLLEDSLDIYLNKSRKNKRNKAAVEAENAALTNTHLFLASITDLDTRLTTVQFDDILKAYEYTFTPEIEWTLAPGDTLINGHRCKKAKCSYAGRDYEAWYAEDISLPVGPYVFGGLPGLIMQLSDTKHNYVFTNNGVEKADSLRDMYLYRKSFITRIYKTSREEALTAIRNDTENFDNLSIEAYKVKKW